MRILPVLIILLLSCQPKGQLYKTNGENIKISDSTKIDRRLEHIVAPYRAKMALEMNEQIGEATELLNNSRKGIESDLGNWMADVVFNTGYNYLKYRDSSITKENCFVILNKGGIRAPINKGPISTGNIFEVMPFDNEIVIVKLEPIKIKDISTYLLENNGQPVSNVIFNLSNSSSNVTIGRQAYGYSEPIYVITSDYLSKGGDKMIFFMDPLSLAQTGILLRDAMLEKVKTDKVIYAPIVKNRIKIEL